MEDHFVCLFACFCGHLFRCIVDYPCWVLALHLQDQLTKKVEIVASRLSCESNCAVIVCNSPAAKASTSKKLNGQQFRTHIYLLLEYVQLTLQIQRNGLQLKTLVYWRIEPTNLSGGLKSEISRSIHETFIVMQKYQNIF